ncbi:MAG: hypothetical protein JKX68_06830 [Flavobacteriales bacterium]|nr:hypothetical protein [Flavobacteriales bacterium]
MDKEKFDKKRAELMKEHWTENLHYGLKELDQKDAVKIVESMSEDEIWRKINLRNCQQDYIADYLLYLWEISPSSFWIQIKHTFDEEEDLLWGSDLMHYEILCENEIPNDVFTTILNYALGDKTLNEQDENLVFCIINTQIKQYDNLNKIKSFIQTLSGKQKKIANQKLKKGMSLTCHYMSC